MESHNNSRMSNSVSKAGSHAASSSVMKTSATGNIKRGGKAQGIDDSSITAETVKSVTRNQTIVQSDSKNQYSKNSDANYHDMDDTDDLTVTVAPHDYADAKPPISSETPQAIPQPTSQTQSQTAAL